VVPPLFEKPKELTPVERIGTYLAIAVLGIIALIVLVCVVEIYRSHVSPPDLSKLNVADHAAAIDLYAKMSAASMTWVNAIFELFALKGFLPLLSVIAGYLLGARSK
jgi:hypothetical protein